MFIALAIENWGIRPCIHRTSKPWKAFLGDWIHDEIMRTFGIEYDMKSDNCCYVLVKLTKKHRTVELEDLEGIRVRAYIQRAIDKLDINDPAEIRRFMKSYGTHYIESFVTGNFIYQVSGYINLIFWPSGLCLIGFWLTTTHDLSTSTYFRPLKL